MKYILVYKTPYIAIGIYTTLYSSFHTISSDNRVTKTDKLLNIYFVKFNIKRYSGEYTSGVTALNCNTYTLN
jgi:hypothetical protein